jgi:hypothetical protein
MVVINPPQYRAIRSLFTPSRVFSGIVARHDGPSDRKQPDLDAVQLVLLLFPDNTCSA